jgi:hypothetical protein
MAWLRTVRKILFHKCSYNQVIENECYFCRPVLRKKIYGVKTRIQFNPPWFWSPLPFCRVTVALRQVQLQKNLGRRKKARQRC